MKIWVDGDSCPKPIKQILFRAAMQRKVSLLLVANHLAITPRSPYITRILVESGFDVADNYIANRVDNVDLVITSDIILADIIVAKGAMALNPRGTLYTEQNIKQILTMRNLTESLRDCGLVKGAMSSLSSKEIQLFANHLDRIISKNHAIKR